MRDPLGSLVIRNRTLPGALPSALENGAIGHASRAKLGNMSSELSEVAEAG
jgi:hypothetical protein